MGIKEAVVGTVVTVVIGGATYTVSQTDVINDMASDTGMSQQQAEEYVKNIKQEDLVTYDKLGAEHVASGKEVLQTVDTIDCVNYQYEWETSTLSCDQGKFQLREMGNDEVALGNAYIKLSSTTASKSDITATMLLIDEASANYELEIVGKFVDAAVRTEAKNSNSYNKATLKAALDS